MDQNLTPIREQTTISGSIAEVWPLLSDPALVASCIPGTTLEAQRPDGIYPAAITVKFGPTVATFTGELKVTYNHEAHRCEVEGRGIDGRGASNVLVAVTVSLEGASSTELVVDGGFSVSGPLENFASSGGVYVARALLAEFAANMAQVIRQRQGGDAGGAEPLPAAPAAELRGGSLLWRAFLGWIRQLIFGKDQGNNK